MDSSSVVDAQSTATTNCISANVSSDDRRFVCSAEDQVAACLQNSEAELDPGPASDAEVVRHQTAENEEKVLRDDIDVDVLDQSSAAESLSETTLEYSLCSDVQDSKVVDSCDTAVAYYAQSAIASVINDDINTVADSRTDAPVASDIQKSVDLLTVQNGVNVDLRNSPAVCSPPTLMVI